MDVESPGSVKTIGGRPAPEQTTFHPARSLYVDRIPQKELVLTCALTIPREDPRTGESRNWNVHLLASLRPGETMLLRMDRPDHVGVLVEWLGWADTVLGMNLQYDLMYLRAATPALRLCLAGGQLLVDLSIVNYLHSEMRQEKSLKTLGPVLGTHVYAEGKTLREGFKFESVDDAEYKNYACSDTHNTVLGIAELARRIVRDFPGSDKLSPECLAFYSQTVWSCLRMAESGIPMNWRRLTRLRDRLGTMCNMAGEKAREVGLILEGKGSQLSKDALLENVIQEIDRCGSMMYVSTAESGSDQERRPSSSGIAVSVRDHALLKLTEKTKKVSFSEENRHLLASLLPRDHSLQKPLRLAEKHTKAQKILSTYVWPLLHHARKNPSDRSSVLVPQNPLFQESPPWKPSPTPVSEGPSSPCSSPCASFSRDLGPETSNGGGSTETLAPTTRGSFPRRMRPSTTLSPDIWLAHPTWFPVPSLAKDSAGDEGGGTTQGRIICKKPPAQTFPPPIQGRIASRFVGGGILSFDLSVIELRVAALLSGDLALIEGLTKGDLHSDRAVEIFGKAWLVERCGKALKKGNPLFNPYRQVGKTVNFGDLYRAGAQKLQGTVLKDAQMLYPLPTFERIVRARRTSRPQLWAWQEERIREARTKGYVILPITGQSRHFLGGTDWDENEIVNFPVQTTAGNTMLAIQHYMHRRLPGLDEPRPRVHMFLNVFDALKFDCAPGWEGEVRRWFTEAVEYVQGPEGYWGRLQKIYGRELPLLWD